MSKQSEIAKQFDLPERQSKLNTMLREEGLRDEQVYCVCRSADVSRFMIGCDHCEEWYHGDCINVTEQEANGIRKFYCKKCRAKNPALQIKYKEKRSHHHHKHRHDKDKHRDKKSSSSKSDKLEKCGECEACYIREDCGRCEYCKDMTKFGGTGKLRQKCKKRQCQNFFHMAKKHHHKSGSKSSSSTDKQSSADYSRNDHSYNTQSKGSSSPLSSSSSSSKPVVSSSSSAVNKTSSGSLIIKSLSQYSTTSSTTTVVSTSPVVSTAISTKESAPVISSSPITSTAAHKTSEVSTSKGSSIVSPLTNLTNSSQNRSTSATVSTSTPIPTSGPSITSTMYNKHDVPLYNDRDFIDDKDLWEPIKKKSKETVSRKRKDLIASRKRKSQESCSEPEDPWSILDAQGPRQCMGPQCIKAAKSGSKYCCDECGLKLAEARIYSVLPPRIQEWKMSSCLAEERDRKQLEKIRSQQLEARKELQVLDDKHKEFDSQLEKWKSVSIDPQADEDGDEEGSEGALIYCVTCGHEVPTRRAVKHMHNCYNKLESQMSFGSMFKTRIEGNNMFCDAFNTTSRTYCKRLRVMCPEHTKESKTSNTEVCGFPLTTDVFTETGKVCRMSKKKCVRHYCWEKLRRANIDMERVRQCLKLDELVEQERQVRLAMTNRAGVLGLMLHSTYDHEYAAKMQKQQQHQQHQQQHQQHHKKQQQRQTDHLYHQDKPQPPSDFHPSSTNYHHQHQIATDHHYHRQQQPDGLPDPGSKPNKKYQTGSKFSPSPSLGASAMPPSLNPPFFNLKLSQSVKPPSESPSGKFGGSGPGKKQHSHPYQTDQFYHNDSPPFNHDHQYFSNQPSAVDDKRNDHMYYSSKKK